MIKKLNLYKNYDETITEIPWLVKKKSRQVDVHLPLMTTKEITFPHWERGNDAEIFLGYSGEQ